MTAEKQPRERTGQAEAERELQKLRGEGGAFVEAVEATRMPMVVTDPTVADNPIIYANAAFLEMCGYDMDEVLGQNYYFLTGHKTDPEIVRHIERAMTARDHIQIEVLLYRKDGREIWVSQFVSPQWEEGRVVRHFASLIDITDRVTAEHELKEMAQSLEQRVEQRTRLLQEAKGKLEAEVERRSKLESVLRDALDRNEETLRQKDYLIKEINHRTKNAIATAASLLRIQALNSERSETREALLTAENRLARIAEVHAMLYQGNTPDQIDFTEYLRRLARNLITSMESVPGQVDLRVDANEVVWGPDVAIPLGLIATEAITNSMKHAFPAGRPGTIGIRLNAMKDGMMRLCLEDSGVGLGSTRRAGALGLKLVDAFAQQIKGKATVTSRTNGGVMVEVIFRDPSVAA